MLMLPHLPDPLVSLRDLALDLRWTWSHEADLLWAHVNRELWESTHNPWTVLQEVSTARLAVLATDKVFLGELDGLVARRRNYLDTPGWFHDAHDPATLKRVAYF